MERIHHFGCRFGLYLGFFFKNITSFLRKKSAHSYYDIHSYLYHCICIYRPARKSVDRSRFVKRFYPSHLIRIIINCSVETSPCWQLQTSNLVKHCRMDRCSDHDNHGYKTSVNSKLHSYSFGCFVVFTDAAFLMP